MKTVSTFEAKNKLSALIAAAEKGKPQVITRNGKETAVIISYDEFRKLTAKQGSLADFLLDSPLRGSTVDLSRSKDDRGRPALRFDEDE